MNEQKEKEFLDKVQVYLESKGALVYREVIPDECKTWNKPFSVDMIIKLENEIIGVEGKYLSTIGQGAVIGEAIDQINQKYRNKTYFDGIKINRWAVALGFDSNELSGHDRAEVLIKNILKHYGIDYLEFVKYWGGEFISIGSGFSNSINIGKKEWKV